jgi:hypothetical protein
MKNECITVNLKLFSNTRAIKNLFKQPAFEMSFLILLRVQHLYSTSPEYLAPLPARRAYRPEGSAYSSER